jgi:hypothetical protein
MALNLASTATITPTTVGQAITTSATAIVTNAASSGHIMKINSLYISNVNGTAAATVNVDVYKNATTAYRVAYQVSIPAGAALSIIDKVIYLQENDSLRLTASVNSYLEAVCSYEDLS